ncbi:MAG: hypothetical protein DBX55_08650 [Verrucomicrobia bacterium]|nr:MAG: hypothetical protein DBX55_08650 [Verrucomicrobiota bacterium]
MAILYFKFMPLNATSIRPLCGVKRKARNPLSKCVQNARLQNTRFQTAFRIPACGIKFRARNAYSVPLRSAPRQSTANPAPSSACAAPRAIRQKSG